MLPLLYAAILVVLALVPASLIISQHEFLLHHGRALLSYVPLSLLDAAPSRPSETYDGFLTGGDTHEYTSFTTESVHLPEREPAYPFSSEMAMSLRDSHSYATTETFQGLSGPELLLFITLAGIAYVVVHYVRPVEYRESASLAAATPSKSSLVLDPLACHGCTMCGPSQEWENKAVDMLVVTAEPLRGSPIPISQGTTTDGIAITNPEARRPSITPGLDIVLPPPVRAVSLGIAEPEKRPPPILNRVNSTDSFWYLSSTEQLDLRQRMSAPFHHPRQNSYLERRQSDGGMTFEESQGLMRAMAEHHDPKGVKMGWDGLPMDTDTDWRARRSGSADPLKRRDAWGWDSPTREKLQPVGKYVVPALRDGQYWLALDELCSGGIKRPHASRPAKGEGRKVRGGSSDSGSTARTLRQTPRLASPGKLGPGKAVPPSITLADALGSSVMGDQEAGKVGVSVGDERTTPSWVDGGGCASLAPGSDPSPTYAQAISSPKAESSSLDDGSSVMAGAAYAERKRPGKLRKGPRKSVASFTSEESHDSLEPTPKQSSMWAFGTAGRKANAEAESRTEAEMKLLDRLEERLLALQKKSLEGPLSSQAKSVIA